MRNAPKPTHAIMIMLIMAVLFVAGPSRSANAFASIDASSTGYTSWSSKSTDFMHARYYSPNLGRFVSIDPVGGSIGSSQSWNRYSYVLNNPVGLLDPDGREPVTATVVAAGAAVTAGVAALATAWWNAESFGSPGETNGEVIVRTSAEAADGARNLAGQLFPMGRTDTGRGGGKATNFYQIGGSYGDPNKDKEPRRRRGKEKKKEGIEPTNPLGHLSGTMGPIKFAAGSVLLNQGRAQDDSSFSVVEQASTHSVEDTLNWIDKRREELKKMKRAKTVSMTAPPKVPKD